MRLSDVEFRAMNTALRRVGQRYFEVPVFRKLGLDACGKDVLEIGCGSGYGAYLLNQMRSKSYVGIDLMPEQIALAKQKYQQFEFIVQDATDLKRFPEASKDIVVIFGVLHHIPEWRKVIDEIVCVLRLGGDLFLEEPLGIDVRLFDFFFRWGHPDSDFGLKALETHLQSHGLNILRKQWTPILTMLHAQKR